MNPLKIIKQTIPKEGWHAVFVCGLGGSGKTTLCDNLLAEFGGVIMRTDWYLTYATRVRRERMRKAIESGDPERIEAEENPVNWYSWEQFAEDLESLRESGRLVIRDAWDQESGEKEFSTELKIEDDSIIWCDGIYMLHPDIALLADLKVMLVASPEVVRQRAEQRDNHRSSKEYLAYKDEIMRKYDLPYFERYAAAADIVVDNSDFNNPKLVQAKKFG